MDYARYQNMDFKKEFNCPLTALEVGTCWSCRQFNYCLNRKEILFNAGLRLEYTPLQLTSIKSCSPFEGGRYSYNDYIRKQHLYYNNCGETYFQ